MKSIQLSASEISDLRDRALALRAMYSKRSEMYDRMEEMWFLDSPRVESSARSIEGGKLTLSPDGHNQLIGAVRLLTGTDPTWSVPSEMNDKDSREMADPIERFAQRMYQAMSKIVGTPPHQDGVLSGMLYSDLDMAIISTKDMHAAAKGKSEAYRKRAEKIAKRTPFIWKTRNPRYCYPFWDGFGLSEHYREVRTTVAQVRADYGEDADAVLGPKGLKPTAEIDLGEYWNLEHHLVWIDGETVLAVPHKLPNIPIVADIIEGSSNLWNDPHRQRMPFLYAMWKSGMWERQNLALTVIATLAFKLGANPIYVYKANQAGKDLYIDQSTPGGHITIEQGEDYSSLAKNVIDPSVMQMLEILEGKVSESTIYKQALGQPLGGNSPFSLVALLSQAGRLPLISPQRKLSLAFARAMEISFDWMRAEGGKRRAQYGSYVVELARKDIPADLELEASLEISLPQDQLQMANTAHQLRGMVPDSWIVENILKEGQPDILRKQMWTEQALQMMFEQFVADLLQRPPAKKPAPETDPTVKGMPNDMAVMGDQAVEA
jgi:hypothetical protein